MQGQYRDVIRQKIADSLAAPMPEFTRRDARLPGVQGKAVAVIGMRRSGKTTFMWQIIADRLADGTGRDGLLYLGFEDERLAGMTSADLNIVVDEYYRLYPEWRVNRRAAFFLDEIQVVPGWEAFARRLMDTERIDLFLSGSSARLLSRDVASSMRGRAMEALIHPFSFREYLRHLGCEPDKAFYRLPGGERSMVESRLREYLANGGFPEAAGAVARDRFDLLRGYVDSVILRDVVERYGVTHPAALRWMVRQLLGNAAGMFSVNKFYGDMRSQGFSIGKDTLHAYLAHLEDAFLIRTIPVASGSERRRMVNPRKVYPVDPGLIPIFDRTARANMGHALETVVMVELERRGADIAYVRTGNGFEVDFLARYPEGGEELIQVCVDLSDPATGKREIRALLDAADEHPSAAKTIISLEHDYSVVDIPEGITMRSASSWLLSDTQDMGRGELHE